MEAQVSQKENKMGVMPVNRLLLSMSVPMMISMLVQALYNVVDSMFVAQLNENALTAVSLVFPIQNLMISVGVGTELVLMRCCPEAWEKENMREQIRQQIMAYFWLFSAIWYLQCWVLWEPECLCAFRPRTHRL